MSGRATRHSTLEKIIIGTACAVVLFGLAVFAVAVYTRSAGKARLAALQHSQEQEGLIPAPFAIFPEPDKAALENGRKLTAALADIEAYRKTHSAFAIAAAMQVISPGVAIPAAQAVKPLFDFSTKEPTPQDWEEFRREIAEGDALTAEARQILKRGVVQEIRFENRPLSGPDSVGRAQTFIFWLRAQALLHLHEGNLPATLDDLDAMQRLARFIGSSHGLVGGLLQAGVWSFCIKTMAWEILQSPGLTEKDLSRLNELLAGDDFLQEAMRNMQLEASTLIPSYYRQIETSASPIIEWTYAGEPKWFFESAPVQKIRRSLWLSLWKDADQAEALSEWGACIREAQRLSASQNWKASSEALALSAPTAPSESFAFPVADLLSTQDTARGILRGTVRVECARQLLLTAIALERWKLKHGDYPAALDALIPDYLGTLPPDWYDGGTLKYRRLDSGKYLLYSVGENGQDEGGDASTTAGSKSMESGKDVVWPRDFRTTPPAP